MNKQELYDQLAKNMRKRTENGQTFYGATLEFLGLEDDGLASRQTGLTTHLAGNAREALETFRIGEVFGRKRMPDVRWNTFVKDTGDVDMIRVPHRACVQIETEGDGHDRAMALLLEIAMGAAIMHQCQLRVVSAQ